MYKVLVDFNAKPEFPDCCVVCGKASPKSRFSIVTRDLRYHVILWLGWNSVRVPGCACCSVRHYLRRIWNASGVLVIAFAIIMFGMIVLGRFMPGWIAGCTSLALICFGFVVEKWLQARWPSRFSVVNCQCLGFIMFGFKDEQRADAFRELNSAHVVVWPPEWDDEMA